MASFKRQSSKKLLIKTTASSKKSLKPDLDKHHSFSGITNETSEIALRSIKYSAPPELLCDKICKFLHTPLDIFPPVDNKEVPRISIWIPFTKHHIELLKQSCEEDALNLIENLLPNNFSPANKHFMKVLLNNVLIWSQKLNYNNKVVSSFLGLYLNTHIFFIGSMWRNQKEVYEFFKQSILLHTVMDPPKSVNILSPSECRSGLLYFCNTYLRILPLLRVQLLPNYQLKLEWNPPVS